MQSIVAQYDKRLMLDVVLGLVKSRLDESNGRQEAKFLAEAAGYPSAMESHSDTNRSQNQHMAVSARRNHQRLVEGFAELRLTNLNKYLASERITLFSIVVIKDRSDETERVIFVIPGASSATFLFYNKEKGKEVEISAVPKEAGLGRALVNKKVGDVISVGPLSYDIIYFE